MLSFGYLTQNMTIVYRNMKIFTNTLTVVKIRTRSNAMKHWTDRALTNWGKKAKCCNHSEFLIFHVVSLVSSLTLPV